jgi:hypothetical protein
MYTQDVNLNVVPVGVRPVVHCSQYDNNLQAIKFTLYKNNVAFPIPSGAAVLINGYKPDNTGFSYAATAISGNTATFTVTQQMTAVAGDVLCELRVRTSNQIIGTLNFILRVEQAPLQDDSILSETEIPLIEQAVDIAANLAEYIQITVDNAEAAKASAEAAAVSATDAATDAASAASDAASVQELYDSIEAAKAAANAAAENANTAAEDLTGFSATANTLEAGASATAAYNASTKRFTFGIPRGPKGDSGIQTQISGLFAMSVDGDGNLYAHCNSNELTAANFRYESDTGALYYVIP